MYIHFLSLFHAQDLNECGFDVMLGTLIIPWHSSFLKSFDFPLSDDAIYSTIGQIGKNDI